MTRFAREGVIRLELSHLRELIEGVEERAKARDDALAEAAKVRGVAYDSHFESVNEHHATVIDVVGKTVTRDEARIAAQSAQEKLEACRTTLETYIKSEINPIHTRLEVLAQTNWPLLVSTIGVMLVVIAGSWALVGLRVDSALAPLQLELRTGEADRSGMHTFVASLNDRLGETRTSVANQKAALAEIETQFCSSDIVRNLMHANDMRAIALLWQKTFEGSAIPTNNAYYPMVCHHQATDPGTG
jgi:hypothetical protein